MHVAIVLALLVLPGGGEDEPSDAVQSRNTAPPRKKSSTSGFRAKADETTPTAKTRPNEDASSARTAPSARPPRTLGPHRDWGIWTVAGLGVTGCFDRWCTYVDPMVSTRVAALFTFTRYLAAGVRFAFLTTHDNPPAGVSTDLLSNILAGAEVRGKYDYREFQLWAGLSFGYSRWVRNYEDRTGGYLRKVDTWMQGGYFGAGLGADFFIVEGLAVGLDFYLYKPFYEKSCEKAVGSTDCHKLTEDEAAAIGGYWDVGVTVTYFFAL
jgi:hypothetical protein